MAFDVVFWAGIGFLAVIVLFVILIYNGLVVLKKRTENAWSQIDVQLKRRYDLIPNLVETVKGYAKHEKSVFENVTKARAGMLKATSVAEKAAAENFLTSALKSLFAVAEAYPKLRANENFLALQEELAGTENKIAYSRQFYNDSVMQLNTSIHQFPSNLIAGLFGFKETEFFEVESPAERKAVKVSF